MIHFDSDTLTHFSFGNENVLRRIEQAGDGPLAVAIVTRFEVLGGRAESILKAADEEGLAKAVERYRQTEEMLSDFLVVDFDEAAIAHFGRLRKQKNLKKMDMGDRLIACIALAHDALLVTRNTKDFKQVPGLRIENWVD